MEKDNVTTEDNIFDIEIPQDDISPDTDSLKYLANILITRRKCAILHDRWLIQSCRGLQAVQISVW